MDIFCRDREKEALQEALDSRRPEFIAVYGRRRIGKTYLVRNYLHDKGLFFHLTGVAGASMKQQLWNFNEEFSRVFLSGVPQECPADWQEAFGRIQEALETKDHDRRIILFFDELPWLATPRSGFLPALTYLWNRHLANNPVVLLIVCGSAASWIINNIINTRGGLHNRLTRRIRLLPFDLRETAIYLRKKGISLDNRQIVDLYMCLGGVPAYLDLATPGKSAAQIIADTCFAREGASLYGEFDRLFRSLFTSSSNHVKLIEILASVQSGLTKKELFLRTGIRSNQTREKVLSELIESGFVSEARTFGHAKRGSLVRLTDNYSLFYLKWKRRIDVSPDRAPASVWLTLQNSQTWKSWSGYAFEGVCWNNGHLIARALGISGILHSFFTWRHTPESAGEPGCQIDLVIDRADRCVNLCEIKYHSARLSLSRDDAIELERKKALFKSKTNTTKTLFTTLITVEPAQPNEHLQRAVAQRLTVDDLFRDF